MDHLDVRDIMVAGHYDCGAVKASVSRSDILLFIESILLCVEVLLFYHTYIPILIFLYVRCTCYIGGETGFGVD